MLILAGVLIAFILVALYTRRHRATRNCRWRKDATGDNGNLRMYRCVTCGAEAFTANPGPPDTCKSTMRPPPL